MQVFKQEDTTKMKTIKYLEDIIKKYNFLKKLVNIWNSLDDMIKVVTVKAGQMQIWRQDSMS